MEMKQLGGGYSLTKSVLDSLGLSYIVERGKTNDGLKWWIRYSDGWVEQGGYIPPTGSENVPSEYEVLFPIEFADTNYYFNQCAYQTEAKTAYVDPGFKDKTTTSIHAFMSWGTSNQNSASWEAKGFAV